MFKTETTRNRTRAIKNKLKNHWNYLFKTKTRPFVSKRRRNKKGSKHDAEMRPKAIVFIENSSDKSSKTLSKNDVEKQQRKSSKKESKREPNVIRKPIKMESGVPKGTKWEPKRPKGTRGNQH